jgi:NADH:ubiquinone reductase (H+-translocating)
LNVVIIGAGYGGLRAVEKLVKDKKINITLIDKNPYHYLQTEAYGYIAGNFDICDITVDIKSWCEGFKRNINFINEEALDINPNNQTIQTATQNIQYDELIIATGAKTNFPSFITGLKENSHGVKVLSRAYEFKAQFEEIIYKKVGSNKAEEFNIVIGGAGLSGVEIAAEMAYIASKFTRSIGIKKSNINIYLVEAYDSILNGMDEYIITHTMERLKELDVKVMTNSFIENVTPNNIILKEKGDLKFDFMIFTGGIVANNLNNKLDVQKNRLNQFEVNGFLNIEGYKNIYAVGDCADIKDKNGNILPPTSQIAEQSASRVAKNIINKMKNIEPKPYEGQMDGMFVALGGNYAVGTLYDKIKVKGYFAYLLKKLITKMYHYGLKFRLNNSFRTRG